MGWFLFSVISLLLLYPILTFLPLKLSRNGKLSLMSIAFLIANLGLFLFQLYSVWISVLALFLLLTLTFYLLKDKKVNTFIDSDS
ncbi:hypothetical protein [Bacillus sp. 03113]|uniref:hypothetical protein n=1 Tax=Bacillus sp. 03113 TaxID=2578211 RepID=UPI00114269F6|nr:hypothetical protein [Bacillus sp. 03113]